MNGRHIIEGLMSVRYCILAFWLCLIGISAFAQANQNAAAAEKPLTAKVDEVFSRFDKPESPGCALAVIKDGRISYGFEINAGTVRDLRFSKEAASNRNQ